MAVSLYAALVPTWLRTLNAGLGWVDKAEAFAKDNQITETDMVGACLIEDMWPLKYQLKSMATHSRGAIEAARAGVFTPNFGEPPADLAALREMLSEAIAFLEGLSEAELEELQGNPMRFEIGEKRLDFANVGEFLLSFSQQNFSFHSVTAYGILRHKGVPVGKLDFLGKLPAKPA